jgi:signal transduction histidine kinase/DNA-directed RNA polymerase specialized sigma24 family protein
MGGRTVTQVDLPISLDVSARSRRVAGETTAAAEKAKGGRRRRTGTSNQHVLSLEVHTLSVGMRTILLVPLLSAAAVVLARRADVQMGALGSLFVAVAVAAGLATLLPYDRLFPTGWGMPVVFTWSVVDLALIGIGIWATGGSGSPLIFLYALTTLFSAVAFTPGTQAVYLALTAVSYSAAVAGSPWDPFTLAVLAGLAFLANLLVGELKRQTAAHREARLESERRWALLSVVSAAARQMSAVDPVVVLRAVVDSVAALGFPTTWIYVHEDGDYRAVLPPGAASEDPLDGIESVRVEVIERALGADHPVVVGLVGDPLGEPLSRLGLSSLVAISVPSADRVEAVLVVGVEQPPGPTAQDVEVFQMLATQAAVALENARQFERQRRAMDRIAELDRMKSDFLSNVSHELRTPLTVISGVGRTLEESWHNLSEDDRTDLLGRLNANAATLDTMVAELLDFGRLDAGRLDAEPGDVDLRELVEGITDRLASLFRGHLVNVDVEQGLTVRADPLLIERVVENLLANAAKYTPPGSLVRVSAVSEGREARITVEDDGPGIAADELTHIGERFFRGGNSTRTRGTGLGLALVSEILDLHGTYLEVESDLGVGSRFSFQLERGRVSASGPSSRGETVSASGLDLSARPVAVSDVGLPDRFETVLAAAQMGLEWSVAALFREFHPRVLRYLRAHLPECAEELASATWNEIAMALPGFEGDERRFRRWVFTVARRRLQETREEGDPPSLGVGIERDRRVPVEPLDVDAALARITALAPTRADVLLLRALGELDVAEIAEITGYPPEAVRVSEMEGLKDLNRAEAARVLGLDPAGSGVER